MKGRRLEMKNKVFTRLAVVLFFLIPLIANAEPALNGKWVLNKKESDDPRKKLDEARKNGSGGETEHRRGGWGHEGSGGPGGGYHGSHERIEDRMKSLDEITIEFAAPEFKITDKDGVVRTYYTDGRATEIEGPGAKLRKVSAKADGEQIILESTGSNGGDSTETYYLSPDATRLYVKVRMKPIMMDDAITFIRVYDRYPPQKAN